MGLHVNGKPKRKIKVGGEEKSVVRTKRRGKATSTGSKNRAAEERRIAESPGSFVLSTDYRPVTKRTYELETKRKGSTKGYKVENGKYFKGFDTIKSGKL